MIAWATCGVLFSFFKEKDRSLSQSSTITSTASYFRFAVWIFTNKFAFRFWTFRFCALPITSRFLAYSLAFGFRGLYNINYLTMCNTMRLFANCNTFWAILSLTSFIWAFNLKFIIKLRSQVFRILRRKLHFLVLDMMYGILMAHR